MQKNMKSFILIALLGIILYLGTNSLTPRINYQSTVWCENKEDEWKEIKMQNFLDWDTLTSIITPNLELPEITDGYIPLPNAKNPEGFRCTTQNNSAMLDMDGDGKAEKELKNGEHMVQYDLVYKDGTKLKYQLRVWQNGTKWCYQRANFMKGTINGEEIILIDDDNNGRYNDYTRDAICIGTGNKFAGLLSRFIVIKNKLYELKVDENGLKIWAKEYKGPVGEIDIIKGLNFPNHLPMVVYLQSTISQEENEPQDKVKAPDNEPDTIPVDKVDALLPKSQTPTKTLSSITTKTPELSLTVYPKDKPIIIPVGTYELQMAIFSNQTRVRKGSFPIIKIEKDKKTVLEWGGPFKLLLKPYIGPGGTIYTFIAPQKWVPPDIAPKQLNCLFVRIDLPTSVLGKNGEEYFSSPEYKDAQGNCMPDNMITSFDISIIAKEPAAGDKTPKDKKLNTVDDNQFTKTWKQWAPSGLVKQAAPEWINSYYECPMYDYLGIVNITVSTKSSIFGKITFDGDLEIKK